MSIHFWSVRTDNGTERTFQGTIDQLQNWLSQFPSGRLFQFSFGQDYDEAQLVGLVIQGYFVPFECVHEYN